MLATITVICASLLERNKFKTSSHDHTYVRVWVTTSFVTERRSYYTLVVPFLARKYQIQKAVVELQCVTCIKMPTIALEVGAYFVRRTFPKARVPIFRGPWRVTGAVSALESNTTGGTAQSP